MILYNYFRSSASYRVRIALNLKQIEYKQVEVHLVNNGGEQHHADYKKINPQELVPSLEINGQVLTQSLAIIDYLDEQFPKPALLPNDPFDKALVKSLALMIACEIHPINNLRVLNYIKRDLNADENQVLTWYHHWLKLGFDAFEAQLKTIDRKAPVCFGSEPSLADICLIPQVYNAKRFNFNMDAYPIINEINHYCMDIAAFKKASP